MLGRLGFSHNLSKPALEDDPVDMWELENASLSQATRTEDKWAVALLGDSTIDNGFYTGGAPDVSGYLEMYLGGDYSVHRAALDGAICSDISSQILSLKECDQIILSVGGNDALSVLSLLHQKTDTVGSAISALNDEVERFRADYRAALECALSLEVPLTVFTIYNGSFEGSSQRSAARMYNDVIFSECLSRSVEVVDLRSVVSEPRDFFNSIEPGNLGGAKFAAAIAECILPNENQTSPDSGISVDEVQRSALKSFADSLFQNEMDGHLGSDRDQIPIGNVIGMEAVEDEWTYEGWDYVAGDDEMSR